MTSMIRWAPWDGVHDQGTASMIKGDVWEPERELGQETGADRAGMRFLAPGKFT
jgi:hypothetical protein